MSNWLQRLAARSGDVQRPAVEPRLRARFEPPREKTASADRLAVARAGGKRVQNGGGTREPEHVHAVPADAADDGGEERRATAAPAVATVQDRPDTIEHGPKRTDGRARRPRSGSDGDRGSPLVRQASEDKQTVDPSGRHSATKQPPEREADRRRPVEDGDDAPARESGQTGRRANGIDAIPRSVTPLFENRGPAEGEVAADSPPRPRGGRPDALAPGARGAGRLSVEAVDVPATRQPVARPAAFSDRAATTAPPPIQISIGRVEVRAVSPAAAAERRPARPAPAMSLDEYLKERDRGRR